MISSSSGCASEGMISPVPISLIDSLGEASSSVLGRSSVSLPCRFVIQGVGAHCCLPKTAWPPTSNFVSFSLDLEI